MRSIAGAGDDSEVDAIEDDEDTGGAAVTVTNGVVEWLSAADNESADSVRFDTDDAIDFGAGVEGTDNVAGVAALLLAESNEDDDEDNASSALISARSASVSACNVSLSIFDQRSLNANVVFVFKPSSNSKNFALTCRIKSRLRARLTRQNALDPLIDGGKQRGVRDVAGLHQFHDLHLLRFVAFEIAQNLLPLLLARVLVGSSRHLTSSAIHRALLQSM